MNVGDCHLISFDDEGSSKDVENWVKMTHTSIVSFNLLILLYIANILQN